MINLLYLFYYYIFQFYQNTKIARIVIVLLVASDNQNNSKTFEAFYMKINCLHRLFITLGAVQRRINT